MFFSLSWYFDTHFRVPMPRGVSPRCLQLPFSKKVFRIFESFLKKIHWTALGMPLELHWNPFPDPSRLHKGATAQAAAVMRILSCLTPIHREELGGGGGFSEF